MPVLDRWTIVISKGFQHDDMFEFGDRFPMDQDAGVENLKELAVQTSR